MADFSNIQKELSSIEKLEREMNLKQLQISRLLNITQAINSNISADGLFNMYNSFLSWEMGIKKMALYIKTEDNWKCESSIGISDELIKLDISSFFPQYTRLNNISNSENDLINEFDIVIPVHHKEHPISFVFIGGFGEDDDMYDKVQFITTITNIIAVAIENKRLFKRQLEQERLKREMELASEMQLMLVPRTLPSDSYYELASIYKPQIGVGGDYFDFIKLDEDKFVFCVADISGKGVAAALLMANFQANLHSLLKSRPILDAFIRDINHSIFRITKGDRFVTFFIAEYCRKERVLHYVNAGHNPPFILMDGVVKELDKGCTILGSFEELPTDIEVGQVKIDDKAMILAYTDGLTDLKDVNDAFINEQLLKDFLRKNESASAQEFNDALMERIEIFRGEQDYPDDFTVLTCKLF